MSEETQETQDIIKEFHDYRKVHPGPMSTNAMSVAGKWETRSRILRVEDLHETEMKAKTCWPRFEGENNAKEEERGQ